MFLGRKKMNETRTQKKKKPHQMLLTPTLPPKFHQRKIFQHSDESNNRFLSAASI